MKILKRAGRPQPTKIQKRIANISTPDLVMWAENALYVIGKEITHHQRDRNMDSLSEALMGAEALYEICKELERRAKNEF